MNIFIRGGKSNKLENSPKTKGCLSYVPGWRWSYLVLAGCFGIVGRRFTGHNRGCFPGVEGLLSLGRCEKALRIGVGFCDGEGTCSWKHDSVGKGGRGTGQGCLLRVSYTT